LGAQDGKDLLNLPYLSYLEKLIVILKTSSDRIHHFETHGVIPAQVLCAMDTSQCGNDQPRFGLSAVTPETKSFKHYKIETM
jgi:hypothetical protein